MGSSEWIFLAFKNTVFSSLHLFFPGYPDCMYFMVASVCECIMVTSCNQGGA